MIEWIPYESPDGFVIDRPEDWEMFEEIGDTSLVLRAPITDPDAFLANLNVVIVEDEKIEQDLDRFTEATLLQHRRTLTDGVVIDVGEALLAGATARRILCAYRQGIFSVTLEQWLTLADNGAVILSGSSSSFQYPQYRDVFGRMVSSFRAGTDG